MKSAWFQKLTSVLGEKRQQRREEKQLTALLAAQIQQIARDSQANFRMVSGYSKKLVQPAQTAYAYIEKQLSFIPEPIILDPARWHADYYLKALFVNADAIRNLVQSSKNLRTFFVKEETDQATAVMTADWKHKTIMTVESEGEMVRRDVPQSVYYFDNHEILEVRGTMTDTQDQLCHRILGVLIIKKIMEIQGLQDWIDNLKKEHDVLDFFVQQPKSEDAMIGTKNDDNRVYEARQVLAELQKKEHELHDQIGDAESQLSQVAAALLNPHPMFNIDAVDLMFNRQGLLVKQTTGFAGSKIKLTKCALVDRPSKVIVWVRVNR